MLSHGANHRRGVLGRGHLSPSVRAQKEFENISCGPGLGFNCAELISWAEGDVHMPGLSTWMLLYAAVTNTRTFQELNAFMFSKEGR